MMGKYLQKMAVSCLVLALFSLRFVNAIGGDGSTLHPLERAWKATGLPLEAMTAEAWLHLDDHGRDRDELIALSRQIREGMVLSQEAETSAGEVDGVRYASFSGIQKNGLVVTGTLYSADAGGTQMSIYGVKRGKISNIESYLKDMTRVLSGFGTDIDLAVLLEGSRAGTLSRLLVEELAGKVLAELGGEWVESQWAPEGSTVEAYTPLLNEAVERHSRGVNLIMSTIYDEAMNTTEVTVATPMLKADPLKPIHIN